MNRLLLVNKAGRVFKVFNSSTRTVSLYLCRLQGDYVIFVGVYQVHSQFSYLVAVCKLSSSRLTNYWTAQLQHGGYIALQRTIPSPNATQFWYFLSDDNIHSPQCRIAAKGVKGRVHMPAVINRPSTEFTIYYCALLVCVRVKILILHQWTNVLTKLWFWQCHLRKAEK